MINCIEMCRILEVLPDAAILVDSHQAIFAANSRAHDLFGFEPDTLKGNTLDLLLPTSVSEMHGRYVKAYFKGPHFRPMGTGFRFKGRKRDDTLFHINIMINTLQCEGQELAMAIIRDESDRIAVEELKQQLEVLNRRLLRAQRLGKLGWWEANLHDDTLIWSQAMRDLFDIEPEKIPSFHEIYARCHPDDRNLVVSDFDKLKASINKRTEYRIKRNDGTLIWVEESIEFLSEHQGKAVVTGVVRDVTEQKELEQKLIRDSVVDELTSMFNRKLFNREIESNFAEFQRNGTPCSIIIYDFDHFKNINDEYGHAVGDAVLKEASIVVKSELRTSDHAFRIGGEEFAILVPATEVGDAVLLAERIKIAISQMIIAAHGCSVSATITAGVSGFKTADTCVDDVMKRSDALLYNGKGISRNIVCY